MDVSDEEVYAKYADELLRFAATLVGPSDADDLLSSAVLRAMSSRSWVDVSNRRAYLYRSVLNEARQLRRSSRRRMIREARAADSGVAESASVRPDVLRAVAKLSVEQRAVVFLTYWCDLTLTDVAETLELSQRTTERRLRSARTLLRSVLR
jgi:RNA polymerase sigma factor (sigma-70 family)